MNNIICRFSTVLIGLCFAGAAHSQGDYPNRTIRIVVPVSAGSTGDVTTRILAGKLTTQMGQPVVVENRPGASGTIGMRMVAQAKPDGYTLVVASSSLAVVAPAVLKSPPYDTLKDFEPVGLISYVPMLLVVSKASPINNVQDLIAYAKREPSSYGNVAPTFQLIMELLKRRAKIDLLAVNYKGPTEATTDLVGGRITVVPDSLGSATPHMQAGRTKAIAVLSPQRLPSLPGVPTMAESGLKDFEFVGWNAVLAPAGTPEAVVHRLNAEMTKALASEEVRKQFAMFGMEPASLSAKQFADKLAHDTVRFADIAKDTGIEKR